MKTSYSFRKKKLSSAEGITASPYEKERKDATKNKPATNESSTLLLVREEELISKGKAAQKREKVLGEKNTGRSGV